MPTCRESRLDVRNPVTRWVILWRASQVKRGRAYQTEEAARAGCQSDGGD